MIAPTTRVFGLVTAEAEDGWLARLYNYLYGFNGLDAAYVTFVVRAEALDAVLGGFVKGRKAEHLHVAPSHWAQAARWAKSAEPFVDAISITDAGVTTRFEHARRLAQFAPARPALLGPDGPLRQLLAREIGEGGGELLVDPAFAGEPTTALTENRPTWSATSWALEHPRRRAMPAGVELGPPFTLWVQRAGDEITAAFGREPRIPGDLADALGEDTFRPCKLTRDDFRAHYPHLR